jgi:hypothetical protein
MIKLFSVKARLLSVRLLGRRRAAALPRARQRALTTKQRCVAPLACRRAAQEKQAKEAAAAAAAGNKGPRQSPGELRVAKGAPRPRPTPLRTHANTQSPDTPLLCASSHTLRTSADTTASRHLGAQPGEDDQHRVPGGSREAAQLRGDHQARRRHLQVRAFRFFRVFALWRASCAARRHPRTGALCVVGVGARCARARVRVRARRRLAGAKQGCLVTRSSLFPPLRAARSGAAPSPSPSSCRPSTRTSRPRSSAKPRHAPHTHAHTLSTHARPKTTRRAHSAPFHPLHYPSRSTTPTSTWRATCASTSCARTGSRC